MRLTNNDINEVRLTNNDINEVRLTNVFSHFHYHTGSVNDTEIDIGYQNAKKNIPGWYASDQGTIRKPNRLIESCIDESLFLASTLNGFLLNE